MQMQAFDMNNGNYQSAPAKEKWSRKIIWAIIGCFIVLLIGLIVAIGFAISGALKKCPDAESCPSNSVVWQDVACCRKTCRKDWDPIPLLLISLDGFRYDYLQRNKTPSIKRLADCGVHAPFMYPSYPTKTFPNHYSIVTGLYPESHGIIDNSMYDSRITPEEQRYFRMDAPSAKNPQWWQGEPFWNTVMKNGMKSATYFWPGSEVRIQNTLPTYTTVYNQSVQFYSRVDQIMDWLLLNESDRPSFLTMYFDQPDSAGHSYGPDSPQVTGALLTVDAQINYLLTRLYEEDLLHCINIVIVADHGMQKIEKVVTLDEYLIPAQNMAVFGGPVARIVLNDSGFSPEEVRDNLTCKNEPYRAYLRQDMPRRTHFMSNPRIGDVVVDGDAGVEIFATAPLFMKTGDHGYDNRVDTMHALFLAWGPSYKQNHTIQPFQNIELYNFFADTLKIETRAPTNGTLGTLDDIFINPPRRSDFEVQNQKTMECVQKSMTCGRCAKTEKSCNQAMHVEDLFTAPTRQKVCLGVICNISVLYNQDLKLPAAIFEMTDPSSKSKKSNLGSCKKLSFSNMDCNKIDSVETVLKSRNMAMVPLSQRSPDGWESRAPMINGFSSGIWQRLENMTSGYIQRFGKLIVISGSIFDYNNDGLRDEISVAQNGSSKLHGFNEITIPSHFYRILIRCAGQFMISDSVSDFVDHCLGDLVPLPFILPNLAEIDNCMEPRAYLQMHMARIRDIELLTGVEFFHSPGNDEKIRKSILLRTRIVEDLW